MIDQSDIILQMSTQKTDADLYVSEVLNDYWICCVSRQASLIGRREVLTGKAKFGILGDGKEVPQVAMARAFKKGDWRSGYYRDMTFMFALGLCTVEAFFAQLYADSDNDPFSGGRQMNNHYSSVSVDADGNWTNHVDTYNISADISSTGGQMARGLGLALASKKYRNIAPLHKGTSFSDNGNEVCFCTIGDASTSEGIFWESMNAAAVMQVPMVVSVWDDGFGISVPKKIQTVKQSISKALEGMRYNKSEDGIDIVQVDGRSYEALRTLYESKIEEVRQTHRPTLIHVEHLTQPQGHSTSGSHERYKDKERLQWEKENDCNLKMRNWILTEGYADEEALQKIEAEAKEYVKAAKNRAWKTFSQPINKNREYLLGLYQNLIEATNIERVEELNQELKKMIDPTGAEVLQNARRMLFALKGKGGAALDQLTQFARAQKEKGWDTYSTNLYSHSKHSALNIPAVPASYSETSPLLNGYQILNRFFDKILESKPEVIAFGEDVGQIGDVNQGFAGMQEKYGVERVFDAGIREWSIMGQAIGLSMRGFRPIAEIQYLDYLIYGIEPLSDDLATLRYRSNGIQQAPAIIRTRGHRLEGIWHAGSPLSMLLGALRGMYICVPRNMTQATGFYNTLLQSDDPALVIECLNGYRLKERLPDNQDTFTLPLGVPETLIEGTDVTLVTYGSCVRVAEKGIELLQECGISVELIDVQTLLPFDLEHHIVESLKKTNRILFMDEDVPGGATAYMMQEVLEKQKGYRYLDAEPQTITAMENRTPYGSDGDYFSKPNSEDVFEKIYALMQEAEPERFPPIF